MIFTLPLDMYCKWYIQIKIILDFASLSKIITLGVLVLMFPLYMYSLKCKQAKAILQNSCFSSLGSYVVSI